MRLYDSHVELSRNNAVNTISVQHLLVALLEVSSDAEIASSAIVSE